MYTYSTLISAHLAEGFYITIRNMYICTVQYNNPIVENTLSRNRDNKYVVIKARYTGISTQLINIYTKCTEGLVSTLLEKQSKFSRYSIKCKENMILH